MHRPTLATVLAMPRLAAFVVAFVLAGAARGEGIEVAAQLGHADAPRAIALSQNGKWLASGDVTRRLILWELATGREIRARTVAGTGISALAFSPDDRQLAIGDYDGHVRLIDAESGRETARLEGGPHAVVAIGWRSRDELAVHYKQSLALWSAEKRERLREHPLALAKSVVEEGRFSQDARFLLALYRPWKKEEHRAYVVEVASGRVVLESPHGYAALAVQGGRPVLYVQEENRILRVDGSGRSDAVLDDPGVKLHATPGPATSPDGRFVLVSAMLETLLVDTRARSRARVGESGSFLLGSPVAMSPSHAAFVYGLNAGMGVLALETSGAAPQLRTLGAATSPATAAAFAIGEDSLVVAHRSPYGLSIPGSGGAEGRLSALDTNTWRVREVSRTAPGAADELALLVATPGAGMTLGFAAGAAHFVARAAGAPKPSVLAVPPPATGASPSGISLVVPCPGAISADRRIGAMARPDGSLTVWDLEAAKRIGEIREYRSLKTTFDFGVGCILQGLAVSPDGRHVVVSNASNVTLDVWSVPDLRRSGGMEAPNLPPRQPVLSAFAFRALAFSPKDDVLAASSDTRTMLLSFPGLAPIRDFGDGSGARRLAFSPDGRWLVNTLHDGTLRAWRLDGAHAPATLAGHADGITALAFSADSRLLVSTSRDGTARIWDLAGARLLAQFVSFNDGEWVLVTPEGYFAASPRGPVQLNFRRGLELFSLNQFYDVFYRPDIVAAKLRGEDIGPLVNLTVDDALRSPPPTVELARLPDAASGRVRVRYTVRSTGGGVGRIRLYLNGKLAHSDDGPAAAAQAAGAPLALAELSPVTAQRALILATRRAVVGERPPRPDLVEGEFELDPVNGENEVSALAFNGRNWLQGEVQRLGFRAERPQAPPRLHVLAVGIDRYRAADAELKRAVADARAFAARLSESARGYFDPARVEVRVLADAEATRASIVAALDDLAARAGPQDAVVVFVAAHGVIDGGRYALVTHDYDGRLADASLIGADALIDASQRVRALDQIFVFDTCHAGGLNLALSGYYDSRMTLFARNSGVHVFAGATDRQGAVDDHEGNGLFTHVLLKGLAAREADRNADGQVSVVELGGFAQAEARRIAAQRKVAQTPVVMHFGRDRPLSRLAP